MNEQIEMPVPATRNVLIVVKPYRVRRGRVNAQVLIDIHNMLSAGIDAEDSVYGINQILKAVDFGLGKPKP